MNPERDKLEKIRFLRGAIEHLDDKAKSDLKIALYGSAFFLVVSLIHVGSLKYASLVAALIDLWYFMSWSSDQLQLDGHRRQLWQLEGKGGLEEAKDQHPAHLFERALYFGTPMVIVALFIAGLVMDWHAIETFVWRVTYVLVNVFLAAIIFVAFFTGTVMDEDIEVKEKIKKEEKTE
jgi:hypothetical protein